MITALILLLWPPPQEVTGKLLAPDRVDGGELVQVQLLDTNATGSIIRVRDSTNLANSRPTFAGAAPHSWAFTGLEGTYLVEITATHDGALRAFDVLVVIGPRPPPPEPERPEPEGTTTAAIIYEGVPPVHGEAAVQQLRAEGTPCVFYQAGGQDTPPAFVRDQLAAAQEVGLPALVVSVGGQVQRALPLPATKQAIIAAVKGGE